LEAAQESVVSKSRPAWWKKTAANAPPRHEIGCQPGHPSDAAGIPTDYFGM
jgi:hypothetical protein